MKAKQKQQAIDLVMRLMSIPGKSCEEAEIASVVTAELLEMGIPQSAIQFDTAHQRTPTRGAVGNMIVKLDGLAGQPRVMLSAHLDTVPICVGCKPKKVGQTIVSANSATGLGADDRAGVAAVLTALRMVLESGVPHSPITICFFVQEEIGLQGSRNLTVSKLGKPAMAFNFDGGNPYKLTMGATGGERLKIKLYGVPAHAGLAPQEGASAIHAAGLAIAALQKGAWLGAVKKGRHTGTSNIGVIQGGAATNVVADYVEVAAEARSHHGPTRTAIADAMQKAFETAAQQIVNSSGVAVRAEVDRRVDYEAFRLSDDAPPVTRAEQAIKALDRQPEHAVTNGGIDANWLVLHGIPTVTLGCGQRNVHTNQESLDISDFLAACEIARSVISYVA